MLAQAEELRALRVIVQQQHAPARDVDPEVGTGLTVDDLWSPYDATLDRLASARSVRSAMKPTLAYFGSWPALILKPSHWQRYRDVDAPARRTLQKGSVSAATLNQELRYLKCCFNWHLTEGRIARNPLQRCKLLKTQSRQTTIPFEADERVVSAAHPLLGVMYLVGVDGGLRPGEARVLEWSWIDFDTGSVNLPWLVTKTRTARQPRLSDRALAALRSLPRVLGCPYVFARAETKRPYSKATVYDWWRSAAKKAGLQAAPGEKRVHQHDTRHTAATRMSRIVPVPVVMRQLGHKSAQMTMRYTHIVDGDLDMMKAKLDAELRSRRRGPRRGAQESTDSNTDLPESVDVVRGSCTVDPA
jgi:integrase